MYAGSILTVLGGESLYYIGALCKIPRFSLVPLLLQGSLVFSDVITYHQHIHTNRKDYSVTEMANMQRYLEAMIYSALTGVLLFVYLLMPANFNDHDAYSSLMRRDILNCTSPHAALDSVCWTTLNLTQWIIHWSKTTGTCEDDDEDQCCLVREVWSTCFLRIYQAGSGSNCTQINSNTYSFTPDLTSNVNKNASAEVHYIIQNIYGRLHPMACNRCLTQSPAINNLFTTLYFAMELAAQQASQSIPGIIETVDPLRKTNVFLNDILTVLTVGLAFVGAPDLEGVKAATKAIGSLVVTAVAQAPTIGRTLWPIATEDSQLYQIEKLQELFADIDSHLLDVFQRGLSSVQSNMAEFLALPRRASFRAPILPQCTVRLWVSM